MPNTRWYSGTGIYRHVWLLTGEKIHIAPWGIFAKTPMVTDESSLVDVAVTIENNSTEAEKLVVRTTILDQDGKKVVETDSSVDAAAGSKAETRQELNVLNPNLWSDVNPYLYTLRTELIREGSVMDRTDTRIGIRSISFDPTNGFQLNGKSIKLKGGCVHHDCGVLGSAAYDRAEERKIQLLKDSGFNAVRCAHNPPSPASWTPATAWGCWSLMKPLTAGARARILMITIPILRIGGRGIWFP
jgi:beta-galactosidase